jgi:ATP-dependent helicase YprA (DUF1998 family)
VPPALVIRDELHLISGPLGTIVGLYETAIDFMCSRDGRTHKIVASTATIRRAQQQKDLYAREAFEFPPQAVRAGESYFAFEDQQSPGRLLHRLRNPGRFDHRGPQARIPRHPLILRAPCVGHHA